MNDTIAYAFSAAVGRADMGERPHNKRLGLRWVSGKSANGTVGMNVTQSNKNARKTGALLHFCSALLFFAFFITLIGYPGDANNFFTFAGVEDPHTARAARPE